MANSKYLKLQTKDSTLNRVQDASREASEPRSVIGKGAVVSANLTTSLVETPHNLGRKPQGAILVKDDGTAAYVLRVADSEVDGDRFIRLAASAALDSASVWIF